MNLSIVILNWNAAADTINCVRQIRAWERLQPLIWVIDNASHDRSTDFIRHECPSVFLIQNSHNLGFAGGTNCGIRAALEVDDRPIMLLNNDAMISEDDTIRLLNTLEQNKEIGLLAPLLFDSQNKEHLISAGGKNPVLHHQTRILELSDDKSETVNVVPCVSGTAVLIQAQLFRQIGLLDEAYFFSTELADLCARAQQEGYLSAVDAHARAYHDVERSADFRSSLYTYYMVRNRFIYLRKFYRHPTKGLLFTFWTLYSLALVLNLYRHGQYATACAVRLALSDGWQQRFGGQNERVLAACQKVSKPS